MATLEKYLNLITSEHRVRPKYIAYVSALLKIAGDVEDLLTTMSQYFNLDTAVGDQLTILADRVGVIRGEYTDDQLRMLIRAAILRNTWDGSSSQAYTTWQMMFPGITMQIVSNTGMEKTVLIIGTPTEEQREMMLSGLIIPVAAGVKLNINFLDPTHPLFAFDTDGSVTYLGGWDVGYWDSATPADTQTQIEEGYNARNE